MQELSSNAYVLRTRPYAESDRIVVLLTEHLGKVSGIAKGARRSRQRFAGGALEPFVEVHVRLSRRPHASLAFLHESRVVRFNERMTGDLDAFAWGSYLTEIVEAMTPERDACRDLYLLYRDLVGRFGGEPIEPLAHHFVLRLLDRAGWAPDFGRCGMCAEPVTEYSRPILDNRGSGVICSAHEAESQGLSLDDPRFRPSRRVIDGGLLDYVRTTAREIPGNADAATIAAATKLLHRLVDLHVGRPLKSRAFLAKLGSETSAA